MVLGVEFIVLELFNNGLTICFCIIQVELNSGSGTVQCTVQLPITYNSSCCLLSGFNHWWEDSLSVWGINGSNIGYSTKSTSPTLHTVCIYLTTIGN